MTPEELMKKAKRAQQLQDHLKLLNDKDVFLLIRLDGSKVFLRKDNYEAIPVTGQTKEFADFIAETVRTKVIYELEAELRELCDEL